MNGLHVYSNVMQYDEVITNPYLYVPEVWYASQVAELTGNA